MVAVLIKRYIDYMSEKEIPRTLVPVIASRWYSIQTSFTIWQIIHLPKTSPTPSSSTSTTYPFSYPGILDLRQVLVLRVRT
jgi:hypothetical protein